MPLTWRLLSCIEMVSILDNSNIETDCILVVLKVKDLMFGDNLWCEQRSSAEIGVAHSLQVQLVTIIINQDYILSGTKVMCLHRITSGYPKHQHKLPPQQHLPLQEVILQNSKTLLKNSTPSDSICPPPLKSPLPLSLCDLMGTRNGIHGRTMWKSILWLMPLIWNNHNKYS